MWEHLDSRAGRACRQVTGSSDLGETGEGRGPGHGPSVHQHSWEFHVSPSLRCSKPPPHRPLLPLSRAHTHTHTLRCVHKDTSAHTPEARVGLKLPSNRTPDWDKPLGMLTFEVPTEGATDSIDLEKPLSLALWRQVNPSMPEAAAGPQHSRNTVWSD